MNREYTFHSCAITTKRGTWGKIVRVEKLFLLWLFIIIHYAYSFAVNLSNSEISYFWIVALHYILYSAATPIATENLGWKMWTSLNDLRFLFHLKTFSFYHTHNTLTYKTLSSFVHRWIWVWMPKNENDLFNWIFHFFIFTGKRNFFQFTCWF